MSVTGKKWLSALRNGAWWVKTIYLMGAGIVLYLLLDSPTRQVSQRDGHREE